MAKLDELTDVLSVIVEPRKPLAEQDNNVETMQ